MYVYLVSFFLCMVIKAAAGNVIQFSFGFYNLHVMFFNLIYSHDVFVYMALNNYGIFVLLVKSP